MPADFVFNMKNPATILIGGGVIFKLFASMGAIALTFNATGNWMIAGGMLLNILWLLL